MTVTKLNDAPVLDQMEGQWMKFFALVVWKLAPNGVEITMADIDKFAAEGGILLTHGHRESFEFRIVTPEAAARLAEHEATTNRGRA